MPNARWLIRDIESDDFWEEVRHERYHTVVMNPPFKLGMYALSLASELVKGDPRNRVIAILPSNYFLTLKRGTSFRDLKLETVTEFRLGTVRYLDDTNVPKPLPDSIYVFKRWVKKPSYVHKTSDVRLSEYDRGV